jgi:tripeptidyl-peptidase-1
VSDPDHVRYGQHLSGSEVDALVQPTDETSDLVHEWLQENGIEDFSYSSAKDWITIHIPVGLYVNPGYKLYVHTSTDFVPRS